MLKEAPGCFSLPVDLISSSTRLPVSALPEKTTRFPWERSGLNTHLSSSRITPPQTFFASSHNSLWSILIRNIRPVLLISILRRFVISMATKYTKYLDNKLFDKKPALRGKAVQIN